MASQKKVIVRLFDGPPVRGYLPAERILDELSLALLDLSGRVHSISLEGIKSISFVKDFNVNDEKDPERLGRRSFVSLPRGEGLLLKVEFRDGDRLEGTTSANLSFIDNLLENRCLSLAPPDPKSNAYRLLVPRSALSAVEVSSMARTRVRKQRPRPVDVQQDGLFD